MLVIITGKQNAELDCGRQALRASRVTGIGTGGEACLTDVAVAIRLWRYSIKSSSV